MSSFKVKHYLLKYGISTKWWVQVFRWPDTQGLHYCPHSPKHLWICLQSWQELQKNKKNILQHCNHTFDKTSAKKQLWHLSD